MWKAKTKTKKSKKKGEKSEKKARKKSKKESEDGDSESDDNLPDIKEMRKLLAQSLLLAQATNIRLGISSIPLPPGEAPTEDTLVKDSAKEEGVEEMQP